MGDINFIHNKKRSHKKGRDKGKSKIKWTDPAKEKIDSPGFNGAMVKAKSSGLFSFIKKKKQSTVSPASSLLKQDSEKYGGGKKEYELIDKEQIKHSRKKLLKEIKESERSKAVLKPEYAKKEKKLGLSWWNSLFKGKPGAKNNFKDNKQADKNKIEKPVKPEKAVEEEQRSELARKKEKKEAPIPPKVFGKDRDILRQGARGDSRYVKKESILDKIFNYLRLLSKRKHGAAEKSGLKKLTHKPKQEVNKEQIKTGNKIKEANKDREKEEFGQSKENWESLNILETNLIRGELSAFFNWKRGLIILILNVFFTGFVIFGIYEGLLSWGEHKKYQEKDISNKIDDLEEKIKPLEEEAKKILSAQKKINHAKTLLDNHIYLTNFFQFLEDNTLSNVYYTPFAVDANGKYSIAATTENFKSIYDQVKLLRLNENVYGVSVNGGDVSINTGSEDEPKSYVGVNFNIDIIINPDLFNK